MTTSALSAAQSRLCYMHTPAWNGTTWIDRPAGADTCWECRRLREDAVDRLCHHCHAQPRLYDELFCPDCLDADDLRDIAALFASHTCACGAGISAEASACFECDPSQYESDRLFDYSAA